MRSQNNEKINFEIIEILFELILNRGSLTTFLSFLSCHEFGKIRSLCHKKILWLDFDTFLEV